jgi:hypothetical protein
MQKQTLSGLLIVLVLLLAALAPARAQTGPGAAGGTTPSPATAAPTSAPAAAPTSTPATPPVYSSSAALWGSTCWTCGLLDAANDARKVYGKKAFDLIGGSLVPLISAILGVWILLQAARLLMPFGAMDGGSKTMTSVFTRIILAIIVLMMVQNYQLFWKINNATIDAGLEGSAAITQKALTAFAPSDGFAGATCDRAALSTAAPVPTAGAPSAATGSPPPAAVDLLAPLEARRSARLYCSLSQMQAGLGVGMDVGISLLMEVVKKPFWAILQGVGGIPIIVGAGVVTGGESTWVLMRMAAGLVLLGVFGLAAFLMVFRFIDVIVKWTVMTVLAPALISLFVFPKTRQIAFGGIKMMLAEAMTLLFMAIIVAVMVSVFGYVLSLDETGVKTMEELSRVELKKGIAEPVFWHLLTIGLMTLGLMSQAASWAGYAMSMPAMMQLPSYGAKAADAVQAAVGQLVSKTGGFMFNRRWDARVRMNTTLRGELTKPHDYATRKKSGRLLSGEN